MKTFSGTFANGHKYMGVGVPENLKTDMVYIDPALDRVIRSSCNPQKVLGTYHTKGDIDFVVAQPWIIGKRLDDWSWVFKNYLKKDDWFLDMVDSLLSLFDRDSRMAFPLEENQYGKERPDEDAGYVKTSEFITRVWSGPDYKYGFGCTECCTGDRCDEDCTATFKGRRSQCTFCKGHGFIKKEDVVEFISYNEWREAESQVRPKSFLIILVK